jgi:hypothetical protein
MDLEPESRRGDRIKRQWQTGKFALSPLWG